MKQLNNANQVVAGPEYQILPTMNSSFDMY